MVGIDKIWAPREGSRGATDGATDNPTEVTALLLNGGRRRGCARAVDSARPSGAPSDRAALHGGERAGHSLQATALVNEAYLRLVDGKAVELARPRALPRGVRSPDAADPRRPRARAALQKRGGVPSRVTFDEALVVTGEPGAGFRGAGRRAGGAREVRRAKEPGGRTAVLWWVERRGNRGGAEVSAEP